MTSSPNPAGRPRQSQGQGSEVRQRLLDAARDQFARRPYAKVSTRELAAAAQSNIGMIRYYFGSKAGLFEAMFAELFHPLMRQFSEQLMGRDGVSIEGIIRAYYEVMGRHPDLPRLVQQVMSLGSDDQQRQILTRAMFQSDQMAALDRALARPGLLRPGVDPQLAKISLMGVLVFPFLIPQGIKQYNGIELTPPFLRRLARHQAAMLQHGLLAENAQ
ncbi:TetR/AcrR family transcriptional regulator [Ferrimonas balearica]|uniref:TetR/AcrR family transcriptional regulator n=1 Tax=Ferrimonas balearica TaxID=44012 RepID=UPI001C996F63|nr:TetR/AcrR family transcriptional regulator [Ferrimonas balearica]MBY5992625.1 TetR/AcrR family transcriptional regulator [Ferrimonas balearica]